MTRNDEHGRRSPRTPECDNIRLVRPPFTLALPPMPARLSDLEIQRALGSLPGWSRRGDVITKTFTFPKFMDGIDFVVHIAQLADAANHHPDIDIRYTKVVVTLSTHDAGGITQNDLDLAKQIENG